jgi:UDP-glucuronate decarboxylase
MKNGKTKHVLVAGGAGFVGSHLCDALIADGAHVVCVDNLMTGRTENLAQLKKDPRFDLIEADVVDPVPARLRSIRWSGVLNLACPASPPHYQADPEHTLLTSVLGTRNLLQLAETAGARFLLTSTSEVYGDPEMHPQREDYWGHVNPTGPRACYDEGKRAAETLSFDYARAGRADVRVARIFNTYGPRMRADDGRVVSNVICQALANEDITVYGHGEQTRSFCYVDDMVDGLMRLYASDARVTGPVNLGNPLELTVNDLVRRVLKMTGSVSAVASRPLPTDDPQRRRPDISRAAEWLGWSPRTDLEDGLKATVAYFAGEASAPAMRRPRRAAAAAVAAI